MRGGLWRYPTVSKVFITQQKDPKSMSRNHFLKKIRCTLIIPGLGVWSGEKTGRSRAHWPALLSLLCELLPKEGVHLKDKVEGS